MRMEIISVPQSKVIDSAIPDTTFQFHGARIELSEPDLSVKNYYIFYLIATASCCVVDEE